MARVGTCVWLGLLLALGGCGSSEGPTTQPIDPGVTPDAGTDEAGGDEAVVGDEAGEEFVPDGVDAEAVEAVEADAPDLPDAEAGCVVDDDCTGKVPGLGPCEVARCLSGQCGPRTADDGASCEDGDPCTEGESCKTGSCQGGAAKACDDGKVCTQDYCQPGEGCRNDPLTGPCSDGSACTEEDACVAGECVGTAVDCDDQNPCTTDSCVAATGCVNEKILSGGCDDGSVCTTGEQCVDGVCKGQQVDCNDQNVCSSDTCDPVSGCQHAAAPGKCSDGKSCTVKDACVEQACVGTPVDCDDGDPCTDDVCVEGTGCTHPLNAAPCDDLNACTKDDTCSEGACAGTPITCTEGKPNECNGAVLTSYGKPGACDGGTCVYPKQVVTCSQGCADGKCVGDPCEGIDCSTPPGACFGAGTCAAGQCTYPYLDDGTTCSDGKACTQADACSMGVCAGAPVACRTPDPDQCLDAKTLKAWRKEGECAEPGGTCSYEWDPVECPGGCVDGVCVEQLGLLQAELTSGGLLGTTSADKEMSCVLPGWSEPAPMKSATFRMTAGFEP
jgi:hypothetical protein